MQAEASFEVGSLRIDLIGPETFVREVTRGWRVAAAGGAPDYRYRVTRSDDARDPYRLCRDRVRVAQGPSAEALSHALFYDVQLRLCDDATDLTLVHAAVVGFDDRLVMIPGESHSGKTTLTAALLHLGATYFSDEQAVIVPSGRVEPFPRPLLLREPEQLPPPIGYPVGSEPGEVRFVLLTHYAPGARWAPTTLSTAECVSKVLQHSLTVRTRPAVTMRALRNLAVGAVCLEGARGDAMNTARKIADLVSQ